MGRMMKRIGDAKDIRAADMRDAEMRAPGALYHKGTDDDTDIGYSLDLRARSTQPRLAARSHSSEG